jgi:predicted alpha/beta superfamily hydrolase
MRLFMALCLALAGPAAAQPAKPVQPATMWNSEQFVLHSDIVGRDYLIQVARPFGRVEGKVPAVYVTDGNMLFAAAAAVAAPNAGKDSTGPAYYIGIAYPEQDREVWLKARAADLTHRDLKGASPTGGGAKFARFLIEELRPAIEARYPVDPAHRVLVGYSFGGLFATRMLLDHPDAFDTWLIGSPSIWAEPDLIDRAKRFSSPERVFIAVGGQEQSFMLEGASGLYDALRRPGSGVTVQHWAVPDENHMTVPPAFLSRALRFALPPVQP